MVETTHNPKDNYGKCLGEYSGRHCGYTSLRCEWHMCPECCKALHDVLKFATTHYKPWVAPVSPAMGFVGKEEGSVNDADKNRLPAIYKPKPTEPVAIPLKETTEEGDFRLNPGDFHLGGDPNG